jgi:hypothetical protein
VSRRMRRLFHARTGLVVANNGHLNEQLRGLETGAGDAPSFLLTRSELAVTVRGLSKLYFGASYTYSYALILSISNAYDR